jgi:transposase
MMERREVMTMPPMVVPGQRQARQMARQEIVRQMELGATVAEAQRRYSVPMHRTTVYRLLKRVQSEGEQVLAERRHGHPVKLRGEALTFLKDHCQRAPSTSSSMVQRLLSERFGIVVSVSQLNRVRATHGLSRQLMPREKTPKTGITIALGYHEQAGGLLLLAAATETGLLTSLEQALPTAPATPAPVCLPLAGSATVRRRLLLTLLFLSAAGIPRTWDLRGYTADGLALLTGRTRAYGYRYTEAFLSQVARADGAEHLTNALAGWATHLWHPPVEETGQAEQQTLTCYIDGHRKPVYSAVLLPRGLIGRLGIVLGCRALLLLHDEHGHPLLVTTHRGDLHLRVGIPALLARYEQQVEHVRVQRMIVDREGMATEFLARLHAQGRSVVTILQTNQYRDLSSFSEVGTFVPLSTDSHGQLTREVAPARINLLRDDHPDEPLCLQVALIRDLRRRIPVRPDPEKARFPSRWDRDLSFDEKAWWREDWQATAAPAKETTTKLIPIVTTEATQTIDAIELAQTYIHRWPAQENVIKDYLRPLGLDTNHGFAKVAVENSEAAKRRTHLEQRLARLKQWAQSAGKRDAQAHRRRQRLSFLGEPGAFLS